MRIPYLLREGWLATTRAGWGIPPLLAILRLTGIFRPGSSSWILFIELAIPVLFALFVSSLLSRERHWKTLEILIATPRRQALLLLIRFSWNLLWLLLAVVAALQPADYLTVIAPALLLGGTALIVALLFTDEIGIGAALLWWGFSFIEVVWRPIGDHTGVAGWFFLATSRTVMPLDDFLLRKWVHLAIGLVLLLLALLVAEYKRSWSSRS